MNDQESDTPELDNSEGYQRVMLLIQMCEPIIAGVASYKQKLIDAGFDSDSATEMAVQFHERLISGMGS